MTDEGQPRKVKTELGYMGRFFKEKAMVIVYQVSLIMGWLLSLVVWGLHALLMFFNLVLHVINTVLLVFIDYISSMISERIPERRRGKIQRQLIYAGIKMAPERVVSISLMYSIVFMGIATIVAVNLTDNIGLILIAMILSFIGVWVTSFMVLNLLAYRRTQSIDKVLPDILDMIAQNMVAGMTTYNSLWAAAKSEFGPLAIEIQSAAKATLGGMPLEGALNQVIERIKSDKVERSIKLIIQGMKSGGELPSVLQGVAKDMRSEQYLKKQMQSETAAYSMFILFALLVGTPLLFSISLQFITIFSRLMVETGVEELSSHVQVGVMSISALPITPEFYFKYVTVTVFTLAFFGSFLIGLIRTGEPIAGLQIAPVLITAAMLIFLIMNYVFNAIFSKMMPI